MRGDVYGNVVSIGIKEGRSDVISLEGVLEHGPWLIRNAPFILKKWNPSSKLSKEELTSVPVEYEWKPQRCGTCLVFGHDDARCPKRGIVDLRNLRKQGGTCLHQLTIKRRKSTPVSNSFSTLEDDNDTPMHNLVDGIKKKVMTPFRKTGIWLGKKKEYSSKSGFTSPNPFDLLTKDDGKSMLRDLQESDDDPDEDDGSDETAHSSKLLGNSTGGNT
ncbi:putative polyprotein [Tanacetum coccineum]